MKEHIEREAAMNACKEAQIKGLPQWNSGLEDALERIKKIPAANDVERKKGHINEDKGGNSFCTECGIQLVTMYLDGTRLVTRPNFCPNCGADLREGDNGN